MGYGVFFSSEKTKYSMFLFCENILMSLPIFSSNFCYLQLIINKFHGNEKQIVEPKNTECSWSNDERPVLKIFVNLSLFASGSGRMKLDIPIHMSVLKIVKKCFRGKKCKTNFKK
jgi:hypothetical protein